MKIIYSKNVNLLNVEEHFLLYPEHNKTVHEIITLLNATVTDETCVVTLSETVLKQLHKMVKSGRINRTKLCFESNIPEFKEYNKPADEFLYTFANYTNHLFR